LAVALREANLDASMSQLKGTAFGVPDAPILTVVVHHFNTSITLVREIGDGYWIELQQPGIVRTLAYWERPPNPPDLPHVVLSLLTGQFEVSKNGVVTIPVAGRRRLRLGDRF
jgi:hypothetical protein